MGHFWTWCYFLLLNITPCGLMDNSYRVISLSMFGNSTLRWKPKLLCGAFSFPGWKSAVMLIKPRWEVKGGKAQVLSVSSTVHSVCSLWLWMMNLKIINRTVLCVEECGDIWLPVRRSARLINHQWQWIMNAGPSEKIGLPICIYAL